MVDKSDEKDSGISALMLAISEMMVANERLAEVWKKVRVDPQELNQADSSRLVNLLVKLVRQGKFVLQSFELLLKIQPNTARKLLMEQYLGADANPDRAGGGVTFNLQFIFMDIVDILGKESLEQLLDPGVIPLSKLMDPRVIFAASMALHKSEEDVAALIRGKIAQ